MKRDWFIFYESFYEAWKNLQNEDRLKYYNRVLSYWIEWINEISDSWVVEAMFTLVRPQIDANNKRFNDWKKGWRPKKETSGYWENKPVVTKKTKKNKPKEKEKEKEKQNVKEKNKDIILSNDNTTEVVEYWNTDVNWMIEIIKTEIEATGLLYKPWKHERPRVQNILTAKEFWLVCEKCWMTRIKFVREIIKLSSKINYCKPINNGSDLYYNYAEVYNKGIRMKNEIITPKKIKVIW